MALYCAGQPAPAVAMDLGVSVNGVYGFLGERELMRSQSEAAKLANDRRRFTEDQWRRVQHTIEQLRACNSDYSSPVPGNWNGIRIEGGSAIRLTTPRFVMGMAMVGNLPGASSLCFQAHRQS